MEPEDEEYKSRSQQKRDYEEVKDLVSQLIDLPAQKLKLIPLADSVRADIREAGKMSKSALNRQIRFIASRLDDEDVAAIRTALVEGPKAPEAKAPDEAQLLGEALVAGDNDVLSDFIEKRPGIDVQRLRQLVRNAKKERKNAKDGKAFDALTAHLKAIE